jgi:hypothetical protein
MTVTEPCVSLTTGTLSPDLRVNYAYGMVLGLDEFLQEQLHRLDKDYLHQRALHGYGAVYGLQVTTEPTSDGSPDFTVTVAPGMAIDQHGREVVVRSAQCARLGAWLAAQEQAHPGTVASHLGVSGELTVYVVASYASCLDNLVPLPGQPCSSSDQTPVASRIRDAWDVDLRWEPPPMPRWDTDRRLARLLDSVQIVAGLDHTLSDEQGLVDAVLALAAEASEGPSDLGPPPGSPSGPVTYQLPADLAAEALDRIFTVWVTQVRPLLEPDLTAPADEWDPAVLLASIIFTPTSPFQAGSPSIESCDDPDDAGRPYLLHTQLLQELHRLTEAVVETPSTPVELATLAPSLDPNGILRLHAWFHLDRPVSLTTPIQVVSESGIAMSFAPSATDTNGNPVAFAQLWTLTAPSAFAVHDGEQLQATFGATTVLVGDPSTTLGDVQTVEGLRFLDATEMGDVVAYATVRVPPAIPAPVASVEFVTITSAALEEKRLRFELWFHPQSRGPQDNVFAIKPTLEAFDEITGNPLKVLSLVQDTVYPNVWLLTTEAPQNARPFPAYVRFLFLTREFVLDSQIIGQLSLADWITKEHIEFIGWDRDKAVIVAFNRVGPAITHLGPGVIDLHGLAQLGPAPAEPTRRATRTRSTTPRKPPGRTRRTRSDQ